MPKHVQSTKLFATSTPSERDPEQAVIVPLPNLATPSVAPANRPADDDLAAWSSRLEIPVAGTLQAREAAADFVARIPIGFARQYGVLGLAGNDLDPKGPLDVALGSVSNWAALDVLRRFLRREIRPVLVPATEILSAINQAYQQWSDDSTQVVQSLDNNASDLDPKSVVLTDDLLDSSGHSPVIKLVNSILFDAIKGRASDVHVQPQEGQLLVRQRIDGVLFDALTVPKDFQEEVVTRCKVLGRMNIAEKRLPQDGRASVRVGDRMIDLRIASLPTSFGERVVIRFLDKSARLYTLEELGLDADSLRDFRRLIKREHGLLLVTGPTGSGKSTTLYAALQEINAKDLNVLTLEDPIEYQLDGISQTQINEKKGMTFARGLRNILRQDPDIIMVGEIRDRETAEMAIQSALTGHLVFSTLHTNDAASAVTRLLDLGIEPYLVASSLIAVIAQRLVRRRCPACNVQKREESMIRLAAQNTCESCRATGFFGRIGLFEQMVVTDQIQQLIQQRANAMQIRKLALTEGMKLLADDGQRKVKDGITTEAEVRRVTSVLADL